MHGPLQLAGGGDRIHPGAGDLRDQHAAARHGSVAVGGAEEVRRPMAGDARRAVLTHDPAGRRDEQHALVRDVGDGARAVRQHVGVVGPVEVPRPRARLVRPPVVPHDLPAGKGDELDRVLHLLARDDGPVVGAEEGVVVVVEGERGRDATPRVAPDDALPAVDQQEAVVAPVGDQKKARERARERRRAGLAGRDGRGGVADGEGRSGWLPQAASSSPTRTTAVEDREPTPTRSHADDPSNSATVQLPAACHLRRNTPPCSAQVAPSPAATHRLLDSGVGV